MNTTKDIQTRERVVKAACRLFRRYGVRGVTMDDIGRELHMSKRTIYEHFSNKEGLLKQAIGLIVAERQAERDRVHAASENVVEAMIRIMNLAMEHMQRVNPALLLDIDRHYPEVQALLREHREEHSYRETVEMIEQGIEEDLFRADIDVDIVVRLFLRQLDVLQDTDLFPPEQYERSELFRSLVLNFLRGIATEKGRHLIDLYVAENGSQ